MRGKEKQLSSKSWYLCSDLKGSNSTMKWTEAQQETAGNLKLAGHWLLLVCVHRTEAEPCNLSKSALMWPAESSVITYQDLNNLNCYTDATKETETYPHTSLKKKRQMCAKLIAPTTASAQPSPICVTFIMIAVKCNFIYQILFKIIKRGQSTHL